MRLNGGLTLMELMVVLAIMVIILAIVLADLPNFRDKTSLQLVAQQIATITRESQIYGITQKQTSSQMERTPYGLFFKKGDKDFILFADANKNSSFDDGSTQIEQRYAISGNIAINDICAGTNDTQAKALTTGQCANNPGQYNTLSVVYTGIYPEPIFCLTKNVGGSCEAVDFSVVRIIIYSSSRNDGRAIEIWKNGQISVTRLSSPVH